MKKRQLWNFRKDSGSPFDPLDKPLDAEPVIPEGEYVPPGYESNPLNYQKPKSIWQKKREREVERFPSFNSRPEWIEKLREIYPEIIGMSEEEINAYFGKTPVEDLLKGKIAKSPLWYFSKDEDPDARPYEPADARSVQPDHYPNVMRPGGGYPEGRGEDKSDARCNKCQDPLDHGYCNRCDWGLQSTSEPINNYPIDPVADERAGIRAAKWNFKDSAAHTDWNQQVSLNNLNLSNLHPKIVEKITSLFDQNPNMTYGQLLDQLAKFSGHYWLNPNQIYKIINYSTQQTVTNKLKERSDKSIIFDWNKPSHKRIAEQAILKVIKENQDDFLKIYNDVVSKSKENSAHIWREIGSVFWNKYKNEIKNQNVILKNMPFRNNASKSFWSTMLPKIRYQIQKNAPEDAMKGVQVRTDVAFTKDQIIEMQEIIKAGVDNRRKQNEERLIPVLRSYCRKNKIPCRLKKDRAGRIVIPEELRQLSNYIDPNTGHIISDMGYVEMHQFLVKNYKKGNFWQKNILKNELDPQIAGTKKFKKAFNIENLLSEYERSLISAGSGRQPNSLNLTRTFSVPGIKETMFDLAKERMPNGTVRRWTNSEIAGHINIILNNYGLSDSLSESTVGDYLRRNLSPGERGRSVSGYANESAGYVYAFEINGDIKIGITNSPYDRYIRYLRQNKIMVPALKEQSEAPVKTYSQKEYDYDKHTRPRPRPKQSKLSTDLNDDELAQLESEATQVNKSWCSPPIQANGKLPGIVAANIEKLWLSNFHNKGYGTSTQFRIDDKSRGQTESITSDPEKLEGGVPAPKEMTFELIVFLIEKMIEIGGKLDYENPSTNFEKAFESAIITDEDMGELIWSHFGGNADALFKVFGSYSKDENGNIIPSTSPIGQIFGLNFSVTPDGLLDAGIAVAIPKEVAAEMREQKGGEKVRAQPKPNQIVGIEPWKAPSTLPSSMIPIPRGQTDEASVDKQIAITELLKSPPAQNPEIFNSQEFQTHWLTSISEIVQNLLASGTPLNQYIHPEWIALFQSWGWPTEPAPQPLTTTSSYQGWSNWETWNTKLMIDNEYDLYMQSRRIVEERRPLEQFAEWATQAVIAPHNQSALADAQEWNEIPYEERPTGREDMPEEARELIEGIEGIFGDDPREDWTADILDESKVNWNEIYNSIGEDIKESEARAHEGGEHELAGAEYIDFLPEELKEAQAEAHPWCPNCNPENPDGPGDLTIPSSWA